MRIFELQGVLPCDLERLGHDASLYTIRADKLYNEVWKKFNNEVVVIHIDKPEDISLRIDGTSIEVSLQQASTNHTIKADAIFCLDKAFVTSSHVLRPYLSQR